METNEFTDSGRSGIPEKRIPNISGEVPLTQSRQWALEYERDENKRQRKFRVSFGALLALLVFILILATCIGWRGLISVIQQFSNASGH